MNHIDRKNARLVEAEGFRDGTQGVDPQITVKEIEAQFAQRQERENQASLERLKSLEGKVEMLQRQKEDAMRHWADMEFKTEGMPPQIVLPACAVACASAVVGGEAVFLAPVMDGFGIADLTYQLLFAGVIVITCSGLFEITKKLFHNRSSANVDDEEIRHEGTKRRTNGVGGLVFFSLLTALAFTFVFTLGWWRAEEMIYAASTQSGTWKEFLTNTPTLTRIVVVLLTTSLPIFVAMAFEWGIDGLHLAWEWRKSRSVYRRNAKRLDETQKALETEIELKESKNKALKEMSEEWKQAYLQNHELGQKTGAWKAPLWREVLKISAVILLLMMVCLILEPFIEQYLESDWLRLLVYACMTSGLGALYASRVIKAWDRPTAEQLYEQRATIFRENKSASQDLVFQPEHFAQGNGTRHTERSAPATAA